MKVSQMSCQLHAGGHLAAPCKGCTMYLLPRVTMAQEYDYISAESVRIACHNGRGAQMRRFEQKILVSIPEA